VRLIQRKDPKEGNKDEESSSKESDEKNKEKVK
jgi:hypothetical protein